MSGGAGPGGAHPSSPDGPPPPPQPRRRREHWDLKLIRELAGAPFGARVPIAELAAMTDRQLWEIWIEPNLPGGRQGGGDGGDPPEDDDDGPPPPTPPGRRLPPGAERTDDGAVTFRDPDSSNGRFRWRVPKVARGRTECDVNGVPISGEAMLDNLLRGGLLKPEDVERVRREKKEAMEKAARSREHPSSPP